MSPELFDRLRRFGDTVDRAAVSAGAPAGPLRDVSEGAPRPIDNPGDDADDLEPAVVRVAVRRHRHYRTIVAAAAALVIAVAGAVVLTRLTRSPNEGRAVASTDAPGLVVDPSPASSSGEEETASTLSTSPPVLAVTSVPAVPPDATTSTNPASTSVPTTTQPTSPPVCPTYTFNSQYPIRLCNRGAAVELIQQRLGVNVDGYFGPSTQRAVRDFQSANGLAVDGLVGQNTWTALRLTPPGTDVDADGVIDPDEMA